MTPIDSPTHKVDAFSNCKKRESYDRVATPHHRIERCQRPWLCRRTSIRTSSNAEQDHASSCDKTLEPRSHLSTPKVSIIKTHSGSQAWNLIEKAPINRPARRADAKLKDQVIEQSRHSSPPDQKASLPFRTDGIIPQDISLRHLLTQSQATLHLAGHEGPPSNPPTLQLSIRRPW